jgi:hypothetical protein
MTKTYYLADVKGVVHLLASQLLAFLAGERRIVMAGVYREVGWQFSLHHSRTHAFRFVVLRAGKRDSKIVSEPGMTHISNDVQTDTSQLFAKYLGNVQSTLSWIKHPDTFSCWKVRKIRDLRRLHFRGHCGPTHRAAAYAK